jgi:hypothetical protein
VSPPDIRTYKGFMGFLGRNLKGRLTKGKTPVLSALERMRRDLDAGLARRRSYHVPEHVSTKIKKSVPLPLATVSKLTRDLVDEKRSEASVGNTRSSNVKGRVLPK